MDALGEQDDGAEEPDATCSPGVFVLNGVSGLDFVREPETRVASSSGADQHTVTFSLPSSSRSSEAWFPCVGAGSSAWL